MANSEWWSDFCWNLNQELSIGMLTGSSHPALRTGHSTLATAACFRSQSLPIPLPSPPPNPHPPQISKSKTKSQSNSNSNSNANSDDESLQLPGAKSGKPQKEENTKVTVSVYYAHPIFSQPQGSTFAGDAVSFPLVATTPHFHPEAYTFYTRQLQLDSEQVVSSQPCSGSQIFLSFSTPSGDRQPFK